MLSVQCKEMLKPNKMLKNMVILATFGNLSAQDISSIISQCSTFYHTEFDFLLLFIHLRPGKNIFKCPAFFYPSKET